MNLKDDIQRVLIEQYRRKKYLRVVAVLMVLVMCVTTYAMILPAIALEKNVLCGKEEHIHTDGCYMLQEVPSLKYTCDAQKNADVVLHYHNEYCYNQAGQLICTLPQMMVHSHTDNCYDEYGELTCNKPEVREHLHTESCYDENFALICGMSQTTTHQHDATCVTSESQKVQVCSAEGSVAHYHDEQCYDETGTLICTLPELETHVHGEECYAETRNQVCQLEETAGHSHTEECFGENGELICDLEESAGHIHDENCFVTENILVCPQQKLSAHQHSSECFAETMVTEQVPVLICGKEEHAHTHECFETPESVTFSYTDDNIDGVITIPWDESLPDDLSCTVVKMNDTTADYDAAYQSAVQAASTEGTMLSGIQIYRLEWMSSGQPYILPKGLTSELVLTLKEAISSDEVLEGLILADPETTSSADELIPWEELQPTEEKTTGEVHPMEEGVTIAEDQPMPEDILLEESLLTGGEDQPTEGDAEEEAPMAEEETDVDFRSYTALSPRAARSITEPESIEIDESGYVATVVPEEEGTFSMRMENANTFALVRTTSKVNGYYYERVDSVEDIRNHYNNGYTEKYVIVYANNLNLAFGTDSWYTAGVEIKPIKGYQNKNYFLIEYLLPNEIGVNGYRNGQTFSNPIDYKDRHWQIKPHPSNSNAFYIWQNEDINDELWTSYWDGNKIYLDHDDKTNTWRIHGASYYMSFDEVSQKPQKQSDRKYMAQTNMLIFRYVGGTLDIPDDIEESQGVEGLPDPWENYQYEEYRSVTGARKGSLASGLMAVENAEITYASDPASANIEGILGSKTKSEIGQALYNIQKKNDGRILTDKSVVYGADDYNATEIPSFGQYNPGDFSVTLSALGQEWMVTDMAEATTPVDVVYVLDISNSMNEADVDGKPRWETAMKALNLSMKHILESNPNNRVGLVAFSNISKKVLPLDRYLPDSNGNFLERDNTQYSFQASFGGDRTYYYDRTANIRTAAGLRYEGTSGGAVRPAGSVPVTSLALIGGWDQTYTQLGIQEAYDTFRELADLDPNYVSFKVAGETFRRQPITILITDGDPTLCTYNYMYPKNGPSYGQGGSFGVEGYYTIMSANYFKNLTSILYQRQSAFLTVGINCYTPYMQAVLDPSAERVSALSNGEEKTAKQLYTLLNNAPGSGFLFTYPVKRQQINGNDAPGYSMDIPGIGYNSPVIRSSYNAYLGNYDYCDKAWFNTFNESTLDMLLADVLDQVSLINNYNFLLEGGSKVEMTDHIGNGMEIKGVPVLRFYGKNYAADSIKTFGKDEQGNPFIVYHWTQIANRRPSDSKKNESTAVPLDGIMAKVTTLPDATQTVEFTIPQNAMPHYFPDLYKNFYYEELPVRLIYRVGLSDAELEKLQVIEGEISERTYYTSKFDMQSGEALTTAAFTPDASNVYYNANTAKREDKVQNISGTVSYRFKEEVKNGEVIQNLGNNGVLTIQRKKNLSIEVEKQWASDVIPAQNVKVMLYASGTRKNTDADQSETGVWVIGTAELSEQNSWAHRWEDLPMNEIKDGYSYNYTAYFVAEQNDGGYLITYLDGEGEKMAAQPILMTSLQGDSSVIKAVPAGGGKIVIINAQPYQLPHTGGSGTLWYTFSGMILLLTAIWRIQAHSKRKGGGL